LEKKERKTLVDGSAREGKDVLPSGRKEEKRTGPFLVQNEKKMVKHPQPHKGEKMRSGRRERGSVS